MNAYKIENILVAVDLSESSLNALETAAAIAKKNGASIQIINVHESSYSYTEESQSNFYNLSNSPDVLNALLGSIQKSYGIKPTLLQTEGNVTENIIRASLLYHSDLIVVGSHGASGFRDGFIGNNTYHVIKYATCPVLSVPYKKKGSSFNRILFPVRPATGALLPYAVVSPFTNPQTLIEVFGLSYRIIETDTSLLDTLVNEIKDQLNKDKVVTKVLWSEGNSIADDVVRYACNTNPDLIILTSSLDITSKSKYVGPHSQKIIHLSKAPVLSIKKIGVPSFA